MNNKAGFKSMRSRCHYLNTETLKIVEEERIYDFRRPPEERKKPISKKILSETTFLLREVSPQTLLRYRSSKRPGFVFKFENRYYFTEIPKNLKLLAQTFKFDDINVNYHLCGKNCRHASAADDRHGGCAKIRDFTTETLYKVQGLSFVKSVASSSRIEKYDFIKLGFESFNTTRNCMYVALCQNYKLTPTRNFQLVGEVLNGRPPLSKKS